MKFAKLAFSLLLTAAVASACPIDTTGAASGDWSRDEGSAFDESGASEEDRVAVSKLVQGMDFHVGVADGHQRSDRPAELRKRRGAAAPAVPEPSPAVLIILGALAIAFSKLRSRRV